MTRDTGVGGTSGYNTVLTGGAGAVAWAATGRWWRRMAARLVCGGVVRGTVIPGSRQGRRSLWESSSVEGRAPVDRVGDKLARRATRT